MVHPAAPAGKPRIPCPAPGIYHNVPPDEYHAWAAASNSALGKMAGGRTAAHARYALDNPDASTPAKIRGDAAHALILEGALFEARYIVAGTCTAQLASGARKGEPCGAAGAALTTGGWRCGKDAHQAGLELASDGRRLVSLSDYHAAEAMRDAVLQHEDARALLAATLGREVSLVFEWPGTRVLCKARLDIAAFAARAAGDVKTTADASAPAFAGSAARFGYYRQDAFYRAGCEALGLPIDNFYFVAVESEPPHLVAVYEIEETDRVLGRYEIEDLLRAWDRCSRTGAWPGYPVGVQPLALPSWKRNATYSIPFIEDEAA